MTDQLPSTTPSLPAEYRSRPGPWWRLCDEIERLRAYENIVTTIDEQLSAGWTLKLAQNLGKFNKDGDAIATGSDSDRSKPVAPPAQATESAAGDIKAIKSLLAKDVCPWCGCSHLIDKRSCCTTSLCASTLIVEVERLQRELDEARRVEHETREDHRRLTEQYAALESKLVDTQRQTGIDYDEVTRERDEARADRARLVVALTDAVYEAEHRSVEEISPERLAKWKAALFNLNGPDVASYDSTSDSHESVGVAASGSPVEPESRPAMDALLSAGAVFGKPHSDDAD